MKTIAYFDCPTGLSGDMTLAALIDAGASFDIIKEHLHRLPIKGWQIDKQYVDKNGLAALKIIITYHDDQNHRNLSQIKEIIQIADLPPRAADIAINTFYILAEAEAKIHGIPIEEVHFHEVGAIDTILDITGTAIALDLLGIEEAYARPLPLNHGQIKCAHGIISLPAPATLELLHGMQLEPSVLTGELITPTGAAILKNILANDGFTTPSFKMIKHGRGAGDKDLPISNILRIYIGETYSGQDEVDVLTTVIDDINPELLGYLWQKAFESGAIDLYYIPVMMKKGRPGFEITLLANPGEGTKFSELLFSETTTLGVRIRKEKRLTQKRSSFEVNTVFGKISIKKAGEGEKTTISPEYNSCLKAATNFNVPLKTVYQAAIFAAYENGKEYI